MSEQARVRVLLAALAMIGLTSSCSQGSSTSAESICQSQSGAKVCLVPAPGGQRYSMKASGFAANSQISIAVSGPSVPTTTPGTAPASVHVDDQGHYPGASGSNLASGLTVPPGSGTLTMTVRGVSSSGQAVTVSVSVTSK